MRAVYGVSNTPILTLHSLLKIANRKNKIQVFPDTAALDEKTKVVIINTVSQFSRMYSELKKQDLYVFIVDTIKALESVSTLVVVDSKKINDVRYKFYQLDSDTLKVLLSANLEQDIEFVDTAIIDILKQTTESALKPIQSFLYSVKDKDVRKVCEKYTYKYLTVPNYSISKLENKLLDAGLNTKRFQKLEVILNAEKIDNLKSAFLICAKSKKDKVEETALLKSVSAFDIRYLLKK